MTIFDFGDPNCLRCKDVRKCDCLCHEEDLVNGRHYKIGREVEDIIVKPVVDLDHFRK